MTEERRLAAIMFADVCGYSRIMGEDEGRALAVVGMASSCVESGADAYGGRIIKKMGDGMLVEFSSAVNAVRCAIEVQRAVSQHNAAAAGAERFQLRIGIHVGDVVVSDGDILGDGVNVASRIEPLAEPGGICISRDVFDLVQNKISIETVNLGAHDLKNISRRIDIYKVIVDAMSSATKQMRWNQASSPRKMWMAALGIAAVIVVAALVVAGKEARFQKRARDGFAVLDERAREQLRSGNPGEAMRLLNSYPEPFRRTKWQKKIDAAKVTVGREAAKKEIAEEQMRFLRAIEENDRPAAFGMLDPELLAQGDGEAVWTRLRLAAGFLKLAKLDADSFRIEEVVVSEDGRTARVLMKVLRRTPEDQKGVWKNTPPSEWRLVSGQWCVRIEAIERPPEDAAPRHKPFRSGLRPARP